MTAEEHLNREAKVNRLVAFLDSRPVAWTAAMVANLTADQRDDVARMAGEKRPASSLTWQRVQNELAHREQVAARKAEGMVAA